MMMEMMGRDSPSPASSNWPEPGICPKYIRSTTLYKMFTSWAMVIGMAMVTMFRAMLPLEKSFWRCSNTALPLSF